MQIKLVCCSTMIMSAPPPWASGLSGNFPLIAKSRKISLRHPARLINYSMSSNSLPSNIWPTYQYISQILLYLKCPEIILGKISCIIIWWFPKIGVPLVIILIFVGFSMKYTIIHHPAIGDPHDYGNPHISG